jgi:hypothetical protein
VVTLTRLPSNRIALASSAPEPDRAYFVEPRTGSRLVRRGSDRIAPGQITRMSRNVTGVTECNRSISGEDVGQVSHY